MIKSLFMREPIKDKNRLEHIIEAIDVILQRTEGMSVEEFLSDKILFGGIVYHTLIIGEAAYKLSKPFIAANPQVNWQEIADMRHHLVHGYYQVDSSIVWSVVKDDLRPLRVQVCEIISHTDWEDWNSQEFIP